MTEVLKLALEAMKYHTAQTRPIHQTNEAIAIVEAVLAQPAQEPEQGLVFNKLLAYVCNVPDDGIYAGELYQERHSLIAEAVEFLDAKALAQPAPLPYMHSQWQEMIAGIPVTFESEADAKRFLTTLKAKLKELNT